MSRYNIINVEDFYEWAKSNKEEYYDFFEDHLSEVLKVEYGDMDADEFYDFCAKDVEAAEDAFEEVVFPLIEVLEESDYFGTEGFNKRFS